MAQEGTLLDDLSGFEFEDVIEDVFRKLGYDNVRQAETRSGDVGRDILMEEVINGERKGVVVQCKHTDAVSRPTIQKTHSAVSTYDFDGPKRGIVVTTGRFTQPAQEYAHDLRNVDDPHPIELIDGTKLREIADEVGLDLYNGRIEVLCQETLRPYDPARSVTAPLDGAIRDVENIDPSECPEPHTRVTFVPFCSVRARTNATFETTVGVIHRVRSQDQRIVRADEDSPTLPTDSVATLISRQNAWRTNPSVPSVP